MARKPDSSPKFFKVMVKDFTRKLCLPLFFSKKWGKFFPVNAKLRHNCETWNVKLVKESVVKFYFTGGWTKFTEDLGLKMGEFLVFRFTGNNTFDVTVYGINGCVRNKLPTNCPAKDSDRDACSSGAGIAGNIKVEVNTDHEDVTDPKDRFEVVENGTNGIRSSDKGRGRPKSAETSGNGAGFTGNINVEANSDHEDVTDPKDGSIVTSFSKKIKRLEIYILQIPKWFSLATGIVGQKSINLLDSKGRNWPVEIVTRRGDMNSVSMTAGWNNFLVGNKVFLGSTISFEYVKGSINCIKATVIENGKKGKQLIWSTKRGPGRPKWVGN